MTIAGDIGLGIFLMGSLIQDIKTKGISGIWLFANLPVAVLISYIGGMGFLDMLYGLALGVVLLGFALISKDRVGRGDAMVVLVMGVYLGLSGCFFSVLLALFMSALFGTGLVLIRKKSPKTRMCFTPFLCGGCAASCVLEYLEIML